LSGPLLAVAAVLLAFAAARELAGGRENEIAATVRRAAARVTGGRIRSLAGAGAWLGLPARIDRAGFGTRVTPGTVLVAKAASAALGLLMAPVVAPAAPGRLAIVAGIGLPLAAFVFPDALLERSARRRRARLVAALPDALDLLAVGVATGRSPSRALREIAAGGSGPLAGELAVSVAEIECGVSQHDAMARLRERIPGAELGALAAALERSRRYGSALADQLHEQSSTLRLAERRRIADRAARAAPKIQLVVALVLVPSVLLMILAALIAHSDALFGAI
jgi:tight adherence protein C